jgi:D-xylose transport system substrate-binding protein
MKTRAIFYFMFAAISLLGVSSCGNKYEKTIGLLMDDFVQERWQKDLDLFLYKAKEMNGEVMVEVAKGDGELQLEQAKKLLALGVKVLVVVPADAENAYKIVEAAHQNGAVVIAYDRIIKNANLDYYVSFDNVKVGELQASYLTKWKPKGNYAVIGGAISDNNSFQFKEGQMNILQPMIEKGDIRIICNDFVKEWKEIEAYHFLKKCIEEHPGISLDAVVVANDALAEGAIEVLKEYGMEGKVLVSGQDAQLDAGRLIVQGLQSMTVYKPIEAIAFTAAITAVKITNREPIRNADRKVNNGKVDVPSILLTPIAVDKNNLLTTVIADGHLEEDEVYATSSEPVEEFEMEIN